MTRTNPAWSEARVSWRSTARIERMFWRSVDLDGVGWYGRRAAITSSACFRVVTTPPLPTPARSGEAHRALYDTYATHVTEHCEPVHLDDRTRHGH